LSENSFDKLEEGTFRALEQLVNIALSGNKIQVVENKAFDDLGIVRSISLAGNQITRIHSAAFSRLPQLKNLFLQRNRLKEFSLDIFSVEKTINSSELNTRLSGDQSEDEIQDSDAEKSGVKEQEDINSRNHRASSSSSHFVSQVMNINVSFNEITELASKASSLLKQESMIITDAIDSVESVAGGRDTNSSSQSSIENKRRENRTRTRISSFLPTSLSSSSLQSSSPTTSDSSPSRPIFRVGILDASHNHISRVGSLDFLCDHLDSLFLSYNKISKIFVDSFQGCKRLHTLALNNNFISSIECFDPSLCSSLSSSSSSDLNKIPRTSIESSSETILQQKQRESPPEKGESWQREAVSVSMTTSQDFLQNLQILNLASNRIEKVILLFPLLNKLSNLKILDLTSNGIQVIDSTSFSSLLPSLQKVILSDNRLVSFECYSFQSRALSVIDLSNNRLSSPPLDCESLTTLVLSHNDINELKEGSFSGLKNLKQLNISSNALSVLESKSLSNLLHLQDLDISNCSLTFLPDFPLPKLLRLRVSRNLVQNTSSHFLSKCRKVKHLDLSHNLLPDVPRNLWRFVPGLIHLDFSFNPIEVLDTTTLNNLLRLRHLDMTGLHLKYIDSRLLHSLK
jgi:Leucine-rich repeat (LRR) protein